MMKTIECQNLNALLCTLSIDFFLFLPITYFLQRNAIIKSRLILFGWEKVWLTPLGQRTIIPFVNLPFQVKSQVSKVLSGWDECAAHTNQHLQKTSSKAHHTLYNNSTKKKPLEE